MSRIEMVEEETELLQMQGEKIRVRVLQNEVGAIRTSKATLAISLMAPSVKERLTCSL